VGPIGSLFRGLIRAADYSKPDEAAVKEAGRAGAQQDRFYRRIAMTAGVTTALGFLSGIALSVWLSTDMQPGAFARDAKLLFGAPPLLGVIGLGLGSSLGLLFAPSAFIDGPVGKKLKEFVGVSSCTGVRVVCGLFVLAILLVVIVIASNLQH
jgi:hypothetical protein